jgi:hypothetical protein
MKGTLAIFASRRQRMPTLLLTNPIRDPLPVMLARRAQRVGNRSAGAAQEYEARHLELAKGRKA